MCGPWLHPGLGDKSYKSTFGEELEKFGKTDCILDYYYYCIMLASRI